jgi:DDE superfamily endonuclease
MLFYPAALPLSRKTLAYAAGVIRHHRRQIGSPWRKLTCGQQAGHADAVIDGTLIPIDHVAADRSFYSGKHHRHGMNLQVISAPDGEILWASGPLPGAVHDLNAARIWGIVRTPYKGKKKPASQKAANRAHAKLKTWHILRKLRCCPWKAGQLAKSHPRPSNPRDRKMKKAH